MRTLRSNPRTAILVSSFLSAALAACSPPPSTHDGNTGTIGLALQVAPGVTINTISWSIANAASGFTQSGTVNVQNSNTIRFQVGWCQNWLQLPRDTSGTFRFYGLPLPSDSGVPGQYLYFERAAATHSG